MVPQQQQKAWKKVEAMTHEISRLAPPSNRDRPNTFGLEVFAYEWIIIVELHSLIFLDRRKEALSFRANTLEHQHIKPHLDEVEGHVGNDRQDNQKYLSNPASRDSICFRNPTSISSIHATQKRLVPLHPAGSS